MYYVYGIIKLLIVFSKQERENEGTAVICCMTYIKHNSVQKENIPFLLLTDIHLSVCTWQPIRHIEIKGCYIPADKELQYEVDKFVFKYYKARHC
jgi:hypothetical protein